MENKKEGKWIFVLALFLELVVLYNFMTEMIPKDAGLKLIYLSIYLSLIYIFSQLICIENSLECSGSMEFQCTDGLSINWFKLPERQCIKNFEYL